MKMYRRCEWTKGEKNKCWNMFQLKNILTVVVSGYNRKIVLSLTPDLFSIGYMNVQNIEHFKYLSLFVHLRYKGCSKKKAQLLLINEQNMCSCHQSNYIWPSKSMDNVKKNGGNLQQKVSSNWNTLYFILFLNPPFFDIVFSLLNIVSFPFPSTDRYLRPTSSWIDPIIE